jgi:hypothetical protein
LIFLETTLITESNLESLLKQSKTDKKDWYLKMAIKVFVKELQLDNENLLQGKVEIRKIPSNTYVMREDSHQVSFIFINFSKIKNHGKQRILKFS